MNDVLWYPYSKMVDNKFVYDILECICYGYCFKTSRQKTNVNILLFAGQYLTACEDNIINGISECWKLTNFLIICLQC